MVDAVLELIEESNTAPTARQISAHAGIGIRSFCLQFNNMDQFFAAVDKQAVGSFWNSFLNGGDREGALTERLGSIAATDGWTFQKHRSLLLAGKKTLHYSSRVLKDNY